MQVRSVLTQRQLSRRALKRAASFADPGECSFSPTTLYEELDGYAKIAYTRDHQTLEVTEALLK